MEVPQRIHRQIIEDLGALGVRFGDTLMVHSSLRALGPVEGGAETIVRSLTAAIGNDGTLLMPALSWEQVPPDLHSTRDTPTHVGALAEHFRVRPGTRRSVHPTHSACSVGRKTADYLDDHHRDDTPCGPHSPFRRLLDDERGRILMLGCGLRPNTAMHAVEERVEPPYLWGPLVRYTITPDVGDAYTAVYRTHGFDGWEQRYDRVLLLDEVAWIREGKVLNADAFLIDAPALCAAVEAKLREDPTFFVQRRRPPDA